MGELKLAKQNWVRIGTDGSIKGHAAHQRIKKPRPLSTTLAKARSLTVQRAATAKKKKASGKENSLCETLLPRRFRLQVEERRERANVQPLGIKYGPDYVIATAAFAAIKTGVSVGKDLQSLAGDIGKLWGAIDQINDEHNSENQNAGSVEEQALANFIAKKKAEDTEDALRQIIYATRGINGWNELVRLRAQIRKKKD